MASKEFPGYFGPPQGDEVNNVDWMIDQAAARVSVMHPVRVVAVYPGDNASVPTTVDVQPMIDMVDPQGNRTPHGVIYGVPAARHHAGGNAIIIDPVVGDVGMMHVADRDASSLFANGGSQSPPGSGRRHDLADGFYHGGLYTIAPTNSINLNGGNMAHSTQGHISHTSKGDQTVESQQGNITHTADQGNIAHTASQGDITHTATLGSISHTAKQNVSLSSTNGGVSLGAGGSTLSIASDGAASITLPTSPGAPGTLWNNAGVVSVA